MKVAAAFGVIGLLGLAACDEAPSSSRVTATGAPVTTVAATPKQAGQLCALSVAQCRSFAKSEGALLPVLKKAAKDRSAIDDATVQSVLDNFVSSQAVADKSCTPVTGTLKRKAQLVSASGQTAVVMGRGSDVCTLVRAN